MAESPKITKKAINDAFTPLSHALLRRGEKSPQTEFNGLKVVGSRLYNRPGQIGPVWNPYYDIYFGPKHLYGGTRDECVEWLHRYHFKSAEQTQPA